MTEPSTQKQSRRGSAGFINREALIAISLFALVLAAVLLFLNRGSGTSPGPPPPTQAEIDQRLGKLQQDFQTALQEKQDLARLAAQARAFTDDHPEQQGGYVLLAQARMGMEQWDRAYAAWDKALGFDDGGFELSKMAGVCAAKLGRVDKALAHYQTAEALSNHEADSEVYAALGRLYLALDNRVDAEQMFKRAVDARGPGEDTNYRHEAYAGLADVSAVRKEFEPAIKWIDKAINMSRLDSDADSAAYHIQKARIYMDAGRDEDAVTMLGYTWNAFPEAVWRIESARLRAKLYERADQLDEAVKYLRRITDIHAAAETRRDKVIADFMALLADWQIKANQIDAAKISLHNLQTLAPDHPAVDGLKSKLP